MYMGPVAGRREDSGRSAHVPTSADATDRSKSPPGKTSGRTRAAAHRSAGAEKPRARPGPGQAVVRSSHTGWGLVICMLLTMPEDAALAVVAPELLSISDCGPDATQSQASLAANIKFCKCPTSKLRTLRILCVHALRLTRTACSQVLQWVPRTRSSSRRTSRH